MNKFTALAVSSALVFGITACSDNKSGGGGLSLTDFQKQMAEAGCDNLIACGSIPATDRADCVAKAKLDLTKPVSYDIAAAVKAGHIKFDGTAAKACVAATKAPPACSFSYQNFGTDCLGIFVPTVANGGACQSGQECLSGTCEGSVASGCGGTCLTPLATGAECDTEASKCAPSDNCVAPEGETAGVCTKLKGLNEDCADTGECGLEFWCRATATDSSLKCRLPAPVGDPCSLYFFGLLNDCDPTLTCDQSVTPNVCKALVAVGGSCTDSYDCVPGATCVGAEFDQDTGELITAGTCQKWLAAGAACDPVSNACPYDYPCSETTSTCTKAVVEVDADCSENFCASGQYCNNDLICKPFVQFGGACTPVDPDVQYAENPCEDGTCSGGVCALVCEAG